MLQLMETVELRPYQEEALTALWTFWEEGQGHHPLIVLPTGAGKSLTMAELCRRAMEWPETRICVLAHRGELIQQNAEAIEQQTGQRVGVYSAGLGSRETWYPITVASIQSIYKHAPRLDPFDLIIIDECFPAGTLIATPDGPVPIEYLKPSDRVLHALGWGLIEGVSERVTHSLVEVRLSDGRAIRCTPEHPIFTDSGWRRADSLAIGARVYDEEAMRAVRNTVRTDDLSERATEGAPLSQAEVLFAILREEAEEPHGRPRHSHAHGEIAAEGRAPAENAWGEWETLACAARRDAGAAGAGMGSRVGRENWQEAGSGLPASLQNRPGVSSREDRDRVGRGESWIEGAPSAGCEEGGIVGGARVESVSRIKSSSPVPVFNLRVSGHPSYFADGILVHNCHRIPPNSTTRYRRFLDEAALQNPAVKFIGFTATPFRMGTGRLDTGEDALFDAIVYNAEVADLIRDGYLSEVVSVGGVRKIDVSGVKIRGGEYVAGELARAADDPDVTTAAVAEIVELGADRKGWLIFATGVAHAEHILEEVRSHGVSCELVTGETGTVERARTIQAFKDRRIRCLVSVEVFLEGFNAPHVDLIGMMRPTKSPVLYIQAVGRGLRTYPGKDNCLLLDYAGVVAELGPIDQIRIKEPRAKEGGMPGEAPAKECPDCRLLVATATRTCSACGFEWPPPTPFEKLQQSAYGGAVLSYQRTQELIEVVGMRLSKWEPNDPSRPNTLLVSYTTTVREVREWLCPEHTGYARTRFEHRCRTEWKITPPTSIEEAIAMADQIPTPVALLVRPQKDNPKYLEVMRRFYE